MNKLKNFLELQSQSMMYVLHDGEWWIAIKPICQALKVDYNRQSQQIRKDKILRKMVRKHYVMAADGKWRRMICLPEKMVYGWLVHLNSKSEALFEYKLKFYEITYEYFKGSFIQ